MRRPGTTCHRRRIGPKLLAFGAGTVAVLLLAGCSKAPLVDEKNPYYRRGMRLLEQRDYSGAAEAFEKCLRLSPASAKAHLQLGMLYEDVFTAPSTAIYHYKQYQRHTPPDERVAGVGNWLARAEEAYLNDLRSRHPDVLVSPPRPADARNAARPQVTPRERKLAERVKELTDEVRVLRSRLADITSRSVDLAATALATRDASPDRAREEAPTAAAPAPTESAAAPPPEEPTPAAADEKRFYIVQKGDTLSSVSREFYGTLRHWPQLRDANKDVLGGSEILKPGMRLVIPPLAELGVTD